MLIHQRKKPMRQVFLLCESWHVGKVGLCSYWGGPGAPGRSSKWQSRGEFHSKAAVLVTPWCAQVQLYRPIEHTAQEWSQMWTANLHQTSMTQHGWESAVLGSCTQAETGMYGEKPLCTVYLLFKININPLKSQVYWKNKQGWSVGATAASESGAVWCAGVRAVGKGLKTFGSL